MIRSIVSNTTYLSFACKRYFSNVFLGNELQKDLKRLFLLIHPDVMSSFPENVREANKNSIQVLNRFLEDVKPFCDSKSGTQVVPPKSTISPEDITKAKIVNFDIFIPPYLMSAVMMGPLYRKKWMEFVSSKLISLFNKSGIISVEEMNKMKSSDVSSIWDGRIESLLVANKRVIKQVQQTVVDEVSKYPEGSMTSNSKERSEYIVMKYDERIKYLRDNQQIVSDGLTNNEREFGMNRLCKSMFYSSSDYHLESPLWRYVVIHLYKGVYRGVSTLHSDRKFHIFVPYMFDDDELSKFLKTNIDKLQEMADASSEKKRIK